MNAHPENFAPHHATEARAVEMAGTLIHGICEHGPRPEIAISKDEMPNPDLADLLAEILTCDAVGTGWNGVLTAILAKHPGERGDRLRAELSDACQAPYAPDRPACIAAREFVLRHHRSRRRWELSQRLAQATSRGEPTAHLIAELSQLDDGAPPPPSFASTPGQRFFYDGRKYYLDAGQEFIPLDERSTVRHIKKMGTDKDEVPDLICEIQTDRFVHHAGPLAGHHRGIHEVSGVKVLATSSPKIIHARPGDWPTIESVLKGLLGDDDEAGNSQLDVFCGWLKFARESLISGQRRPGQALALCGPRGSGKSLLIDLVELCLGGRRANPHAYFTGRTHFNGDLAGAELLAVDDEAGSTDFRARKHFAAAIKSCLFSGSVRIEGKHKSGFNFRPCWRMVLALNDEPEALLVLPPLTEDVKDKVTLLRCHRRPLPMPAFTLDEREKFFATLKAEIPAFADFLAGFEIPESMAEERCGVTFYHHPELLKSLHQLSPEAQLEELIDRAAMAGGLTLPWQGFAHELKSLLVSCQATSRDADKLLSWHAACGGYLARIPDRATRLPQREGIHQWAIK